MHNARTLSCTSHAQLMRPGITRNVFHAVGDFRTLEYGIGTNTQKLYE